MNTIETTEEYYKKLSELCNKLRYNRVTVSQHPTFTFDTVKSTNWTLELIRVAHSASEMILMQQKKKKILEKE